MREQASEAGFQSAPPHTCRGRKHTCFGAVVAELVLPIPTAANAVMDMDRNGNNKRKTDRKREEGREQE